MDKPDSCMNSSISELDREALRIKALKRYDILDTPRDGTFDRLTRLACQFLNVPIAIVSLVDEDRIWFKSSYGMDAQQIDREPGLCASAILTDDFYMVENAAIDPRTLANPLVAGQFGLKFYAAFPLKTYDGYNLGTFCIIDKQPRQLNEMEISALKDLRDTVMDHLELRLAARTAISQQKNIVDMAVHDLKTPLTNVSVRAELIERKKDNPKAVSLLAKQIRESSSKITENINKLLIKSGREMATFQFHRETLDLAGIIERIVASNMAIAAHKEQQILVDIISRPKVLGDESQMTEVIENLVNNAIKYSFIKATIRITLDMVEQMAIVRISDDGPGFTEEDHEKMFQRFARLSARPTGNESSSGLGLSIAKQLIEQHGGRIWAEKQNNMIKGATLLIELPSL